jgi:hypothetical protein
VEFQKCFCPAWPGTIVLLISVSQVARITGMSHHRPACILVFSFIICNNTESLQSMHVN